LEEEEAVFCPPLQLHRCLKWNRLGEEEKLLKRVIDLDLP